MDASPTFDTNLPILKYGRILLLLGLGGLSLATWPLWTGTSELPGIPWIPFLCRTPHWVDWLLLALTVFSLASAAGLKSHKGLATAVAMLAWGGLLLLDQQRVQTWAWQFWLLLLIYTVVQESDLCTVWRWLVISIYFWSACSKLDRGFLDGHGQLLLEGLLNSIGQTTKFWTPAGRQFGALLMPLTELGLALLLMFRWTRSWGWGGSLAMHTGLLFTLGMHGLGHEWGVLGWNIWFLAQNALLWFSETDQEPSIQRAGRFLSVAVFTYPALQFPGLCDHWPAWEVYCARPELVRLQVSPEQVAALPESVRPFVQPAAPFQLLQSVRIEGWGYEQVLSPLYPQERYRLALLSSLLTKLPDGSWTIDVASSPNRFTGQREQIALRNHAELQQHLNKFLVNTLPRMNYPKQQQTHSNEITQ